MFRYLEIIVLVTEFSKISMPPTNEEHMHADDRKELGTSTF